MENVYPQFYEFFDSVPIPDSLKDKIIDEDGRPITSIKGTRKINIIVGENDAGKSYLMRELFKNPQTPNYESKNVFLKIKKVVTEAMYELCAILDAASNGMSAKDWVLKTHRKEITSYVSSLGDHNYLRKKGFNFLNVERLEGGEFLSLLSILIDYNYFLVNEQNKNAFQMIVNQENVTNESSIQDAIIDYDLLRGWVDKTITRLHPFVFNFDKHFRRDGSERVFPSNWTKKYSHYFMHHLRTLRKDELKNIRRITSEIIYAEENWSIEKDSDTILLNSDRETSKPYFEYGYVETGATLYKSIENKFNNIDGRKRIQKFESFLSNEVFDNADIMIIPGKSILSEGLFSPEVFQIQIGDQKPRPIHELGTGIQMIIILTWFMFESDYGVVFIEEPELFIHPSLQRQLMNIYARHPRSDKFKFFIATHSNHITDFIQYEPELCSMYMIKKDLRDNPEDPKFILKHYTEDEVLQTLGVTQSSLFLANCTIWVEGNTDWKYIRTWFELYLRTKEPKEHFKEGLHYAFVEYGGNLIDHWCFKDETKSEDAKEKTRERLKVNDVSRKAFVITDKGKNNKRNEELAERIQNLFILKSYEIENLLHDEVLCSVLDRYYEKKSGKKLIQSDQNGFRANKSIKQIPHLISDYFVYDSGGKIPISNWNDDTSLKQKLCALANEEVKARSEILGRSRKLERVDTTSIISDEAYELCEIMFEFIKHHNG